MVGGSRGTRWSGGRQQEGWSGGRQQEVVEWWEAAGERGGVVGGSNRTGWSGGRQQVNRVEWLVATRERGGRALSLACTARLTVTVGLDVFTWSCRFVGFLCLACQAAYDGLQVEQY